MDGNGLLKEYALSMEDKMAARAFKRHRNYGWIMDPSKYSAIRLNSLKMIIIKSSCLILNLDTNNNNNYNNNYNNIFFDFATQ